jgi:glycosyltransferase involved in cell wall biosynthesis
MIIEAMHVAAERANVFCAFIGDGDTTSLSSAVQRTGLGDRCAIHGYSRAARRIAAAADVLVLPSRSEGQPLSVLEAFADGVLVAVSRIPELVELVDDGVTGMVFDANDAVALADTLAAIARTPADERAAMRRRARQVFLANFSATAMTRKYFSTYQGLGRDRGRGPRSEVRGQREGERVEVRGEVGGVRSKV